MRRGQHFHLPLLEVRSEWVLMKPGVNLEQMTITTIAGVMISETEDLLVFQRRHHLLEAGHVTMIDLHLTEGIAIGIVIGETGAEMNRDNLHGQEHGQEGDLQLI